MPVTINASPTNGIVQTADGSGVMKLQSNGVTTNALAWVNFNGTGTVAIRSAYNVSSITDNGTGDYTVNFATALSDANYSFVATSGSGGWVTRIASMAAGNCNIQTIVGNTTTSTDTAFVLCAVFGN